MHACHLTPFPSRSNEIICRHEFSYTLVLQYVENNGWNGWMEGKEGKNSERFGLGREGKERKGKLYVSWDGSIKSLLCFSLFLFSVGLPYFIGAFFFFLLVGLCELVGQQQVVFFWWRGKYGYWVRRI